MTTRIYNKKLCNVDIHGTITENNDDHFMVFCASSQIDKLVKLFNRHKSNFVPRLGSNAIKVKYKADKPVFSHGMPNAELINRFIDDNAIVDITAECRFSSWKTANGSTNSSITFIAKKILITETDLGANMDKIVFAKS